uniref:RNase H type-1 domain-containing protein n=1 Tax=Cannabis sativa TaxID=3483 RepID=A0A803PI90_CANSA
MHPDKAPGPGRMGPGFFQKHWDIKGSNVIKIVQEFVASGSFPQYLNETNLVLIPKKKNFSNMGDVRPISVMLLISTFILGRLISDNVMVAFEVMHYLKRKSKGLSGLIKKLESQRVIQGCKVARGAPLITHMLFANDSMPEATKGSLYLRLPNIIGRNKNAVLGFLKNKWKSASSKGQGIIWMSWDRMENHKLDGDFLSTELGDNPSFVRRSTWSTQSLVRLGARRTVGTGDSGDGAELWTKPEENSIKINVDAATFEQENKYGFGIVACNHLGDLITALSGCYGGNFAAEFIEVMAIKEALSWVKGQHWEQVIIETDSLISVQAIRSQQKMFSTFGLIVADCKVLLCTLHNVQLLFIKRLANRVAHYVARNDRFNTGCSLYVFHVSKDLKNLMYSEC